MLNATVANAKISVAPNKTVRAAERPHVVRCSDATLFGELLIASGLPLERAFKGRKNSLAYMNDAELGSFMTHAAARSQFPA